LEPLLLGTLPILVKAKYWKSDGRGNVKFTANMLIATLLLAAGLFT
jgi:hypothetical protein